MFPFVTSLCSHNLFNNLCILEDFYPSYIIYFFRDIRILFSKLYRILCYLIYFKILEIKLLPESLGKYGWILVHVWMDIQFRKNLKNVIFIPFSFAYIGVSNF